MVFDASARPDAGQPISPATHSAGARPQRLAARGRWPDDIALWRVDFDFAQTPADAPFLDDAERARAQRYLQRADQIRFAVTRSVLRQLLADAIGDAPDALRFVFSERGKPQLQDHIGLSFNVSHAGNHALIALSRTREVGIDIEQHNASIDWRGLSRLVCTPAERQALDSAPPPSQAALFMHCWTAKEALLKALGLGIAHGLLALGVDLAGEGGVERAASPHVVGSAGEFGAASQLHYRWLDDVPGYACCLAFAKPGSIARNGA